MRFYPETNETDEDLKFSITSTKMHYLFHDIKYELVTSELISEELKQYCIDNDVTVVKVNEVN